VSAPGVAVVANDGAAAPFRRAAILGVGLIGGSVAAALRRAGLAGEIVGSSPGQDARTAHAIGLVDRCEPDAARAVRDADLVVLAAPIAAIGRLFPVIAPHLAADALVTDCASTKGSTVEAARAALGDAFERFVPGHPIAGGERHGPHAARADLFERAVTVLCPQPATGAGPLERVRALWTAFGARVTELSVQAHDELFAEVSHWPHAVAFALCGAIAAGERAETAQRFAGAGLRDTTRIAASSADLWAGILLDNREPVLACAQAFERELAAVLDALRRADRDALRARFEAASAWRRGVG